jgi:hypothetical protein
VSFDVLKSIFYKIKAERNTAQRRYCVHHVSALLLCMLDNMLGFPYYLLVLCYFYLEKIYGEVVGALPLNGGAYNVLLNTSSKD